MKKILVILSSVLLISGVTSCGNKETERIIPEEERIQLIGEHMKEYLTSDKPISEFENVKDDKQTPYTIKIGSLDNPDYEFILSTKKDYSDPLTYNLKANSISLTNLLIDTTYYWKATSNNVDIQYYGDFTTQSYSPRVINVDGINNVRDIGGWTYEENKKIAQGLIYRGSEMNKHYTISDVGKETMLNTLGIKTDLDLRKVSEIDEITASPLGESVNWVNLTSFDGYQKCTYPDQKENYKQVFKMLANPSSYPIYIHCYQGADRTGTICSMIEALMGVNDHDRLLDYNLTTFSSGDDCYRDGESSKRNYSFIKKNIESSHKAESFKESMELYLKNFLEITDEEITSIKNILSGQTKIPGIKIGEIKA